MATQHDEAGVPISVAHQFQSFRLLELPLELVELIDAPNPPLLTIKSQAASAGSGPGISNAKPAYAVLCTPNKTFQLRQVQTSNSLLVTQPGLATHGNKIPIPATCAIASCTATLELQASTASAVALLNEALPVYDIIAGDVDATHNGKSKMSIFEHLPMSDAECQAAWIETMAFEHEGSSYQPSSNALVQAWRSINAAALAEGIKLDSQFLTADINRAASEEDHPEGLIAAILACLLQPDMDTSGAWSCLDRIKTVKFVGTTLLHAKRGGDFLIADFTDTWEDRLPEMWRKDAQLSAIEGQYEFPTETTISAKGKAAGRLGANDTATIAKPSVRKWHEKFGKTRKP